MTIAAILCLPNLGQGGVSPEATSRKDLPAAPILRVETTDLHSSDITSLDVDLEERFVVTGSKDKTVRVWDIATGKLLQILRPPIDEGKEGIIQAVAISPNGKTVACAGDVGFTWEGAWVIYVFDRESGTLMKRIAGLPHAVVQLTYSRDGEVLAAGLKGKGGAGIRVYQTTDYRSVGEDKDYGNPNYDGTVSGMAFDDAGNLVTVSADGNVRRYDYKLRLLENRSAYLTRGRPSGVSMSPDGNEIAISSSESSWSLLRHEGEHFSKISTNPIFPPGSTWGVTAYAQDGKRFHHAYFREEDSGYVKTAGNVDDKFDYGNFQNVGVLHVDGVGDKDERFPFPIKPQADSVLVYLPNRPIALRGLKDGGLVYAVVDGFAVLRPKKDPNPGREKLGLFYRNDTGHILVMTAETSTSKNLCCGGPIGSLKVSQDGTIVDFQDYSGGYVNGAQAVVTLQWRDDRYHGLGEKQETKIPERFSGKGPVKNRRWQFNLVKGQLTEHTSDAPENLADFQPPRTIARGFHLTNWDDKDAPKLNDRPLSLMKDERSKAIAITPDGKAVLIGTTHFLRSYNSDGQLQWKTPVEAAIREVNVTSKGAVAVAALDDGTIRSFRLNDGASLLNLFVKSSKGSIHSTNTSGPKPLQTRAISERSSQWILWTPTGYFDASEGAEDLIGWHVNQGPDKEALFFPASHFFEQYYRPDLIQEVLRSTSTDAEVLARSKEKELERVVVSRGFKLPPKAKILVPASGAQVAQGEVEVQVQVEEQGGGIEELRWYLNGKLVGSEALGGASAEKVVQRTRRVPLLPGRNLVRVVALSKDRIEGLADERSIERPGGTADGAASPSAAEKPTLHVLVVGLNQYKNPALNLNYALPDARGLQAYFDVGTSRLFQEVKRYELYDAAATKAAILEKLTALHASAPQDVVLVYLAGHGESVGDTWYFVPYEVTTPERDEVLQERAFSSKELLEQIPKIKAQKVLVLMDSCKSGAALNAFGKRGIDDRRALAQLARAAGTFLVAAATSEQDAGEVKALGHGLFTYTLLQGLGGEADSGKQKDGVVTVREALTYVEQMLPELSTKYKSQPQYPVIHSNGMDFPLAAVR